MIYLDNASTTKMDDRVLDAMMPYLTESYGNAGTLYELGRRSADAVAVARKQVADMIGASPEQIIFTSGGSEANNFVFAGLSDYLLSVGKTRIVTSQIEHDSVLKAASKMCIKDRFDVSFVAPSPNGRVENNDTLRSLVSDKHTGLVSIMHTNNETGISNPVGAIGEICREHGVLFHTDCVQAAGCADLNVDALRCDFLSLSSHKIHGAKGVGALYARDKSLLSPIISGGHEQEFGLRGGTENVAGIVGFGKACEIIRQHRVRAADYIGWLRQELYNLIKAKLERRGLGAILHLNGDVNLTTDDGKTMSVRFDGVDAETLLLMLDAYGVCVSAGSACRSHEQEPSHVLLAMGISPEDARNSIRLSVSRMNTIEEIERAAEIIADCVATLRKIGVLYR